MFRALAATTLVLASAGCSEAPSSKATASEETSPTAVTAATGPKITGTGYSYRVPETWGRAPQEIPGFDPDSFAVNLQDSDGFTDNVNVLLSPAEAMTPQQAEDSAADELRAAGAQDIAIRDRVTVSGSESARVSAVMAINANEYTIEQFYPSHDGKTFVVTFSFSSTVDVGERAEVTDAVLDSWAWTD